MPRLGGFPLLSFSGSDALRASRDRCLRLDDQTPRAHLLHPNTGRLGKRQQATAAQTLEQSLGATVVRKHPRTARRLECLSLALPTGL